MAKQQQKVVPTKAKPLGAYPHIKRAGDFLFVSGTSARQAGDRIPGAELDGSGDWKLDIGLQTRATIENLRDILTSMNAGLGDLVDIMTFLVDMGDFASYNEVYGEYFDESGPSRTTVAVRALPHPHLLIEMKAVAYRPPGRD